MSTMRCSHPGLSSQPAMKKDWSKSLISPHEQQQILADVHQDEARVSSTCREVRYENV